MNYPDHELEFEMLKIEDNTTKESKTPIVIHTIEELEERKYYSVFLHIASKKEINHPELYDIVMAGKYYYKNSNYVRAIVCFEKAIKHNCISSLLSLSDIMKYLKNYEESFRLRMQYIETKDNLRDFDHIADLALLHYVKTKKMDLVLEAIKFYEDKKEVVSCFNDYMNLLLLTKQYLKAIEFLDHAKPRQSYCANFYWRGLVHAAINNKMSHTEVVEEIDRQSHWGSPWGKVLGMCEEVSKEN